jgi:hypothetical protein
MVVPWNNLSLVNGVVPRGAIETFVYFGNLFSSISFVNEKDNSKKCSNP